MTGWRLPAEELEARVEAIIRGLLSDVTLAGRLVARPDTDEIARLRSALDVQTGSEGRAELLELIGRIDIGPGRLMLALDAALLARHLSIDADRINLNELKTSVTFQLRKRGVETRLILDDAPVGRDDTLIRNIARAHYWFEQIRAGRDFDEIAKTEGISKRRIQQIIDLAFLAPDIVRDVLDGKQPLGFTSDWCKTHALPSDWDAQRRMVAAL